MNAIAHASTGPAGPQLDNRRVLAGVIDLAIILAGGFVLSTVLAFATGGEAGLSSRLVLIMVGWALYYYFAFESGDGQTVGKKLMKLRVVRVDGAPLGMREVTLRTLLRVVDGPFVPLLGLIVMMVTGERRQRLGDLAAGTMVADASAEPADVKSDAVAGPVAEPEAPAEEPAAEAAATEPAAAEEPVHQGFAPPAPAPDPDFEVAAAAEGMSPPQEAPPAPEASGFDPYSLTQEPEPEAEPEVEQPSYPAPVAVEPLVEAAPAEELVAPEPVVEEPVADEPAAEPAQPEPEPEEEAMTVRPMQTMSAIDLVMGEDEDRDESPEGDDGRQPQPE